MQCFVNLFNYESIKKKIFVLLISSVLIFNTTFESKAEVVSLSLLGGILVVTALVGCGLAITDEEQLAYFINSSIDFAQLTGKTFNHILEGTKQTVDGAIKAAPPLIDYCKEFVKARFKNNGSNEVILKAGKDFVFDSKVSEFNANDSNLPRLNFDFKPSTGVWGDFSIVSENTGFTTNSHYLYQVSYKYKNKDILKKQELSYYFDSMMYQKIVRKGDVLGVAYYGNDWEKCKFLELGNYADIIGASSISVPYSCVSSVAVDDDKFAEPVYLPKNVKDLVGNVGAFKPTDTKPHARHGEDIVIDVKDTVANRVDNLVTGKNTVVNDISVSDTVAPPTDIDIPNDIAGFITSLFVLDEQWFYGKFDGILSLLEKKYSGINLEGLKQICVGGSPLPDIAVNFPTLGVQDKAVILNSSQTVNTVFMWIRGLVQCVTSIFVLMYLYNQVYYLIRGTKPISSSSTGV